MDVYLHVSRRKYRSETLTRRVQRNLGGLRVDLWLAASHLLNEHRGDRKGEWDGLLKSRRFRVFCSWLAQIAPALGRFLAPDVFHKNPPHRLSGCAKEMATTVPMLGLVDIHQPNVRVVHQRRRLQRLAWLLPGQRYLDDEAVEACPPSKLYRLRKFTRRNRVAVGTSIAIALALILGAGVAAGRAYRAAKTERFANEELGVAQKQQRLAQEAAENERRQKEEAEQSRFGDDSSEVRRHEQRSTGIDH